MDRKKRDRALAAHFAANRVATDRLGLVENIGWTDAAREVSLRVRQNKARIRELMKDRPDGTTYRDASGTWIKRGGDVELVRVDGVYVAGQNNGRFITELAAGRRGDYSDPYALGTVSAMQYLGYLTPLQADRMRRDLGYYGTVGAPTAGAGLTGVVGRTARSGLDAYRDMAARAYGSRNRFGKAGVFVANIGWTDEARAASLAVRQKKAAERQAALDAAKPFKAHGSGKAKAPSSGGAVREQTPEMEAALGNPNTPFEGKRIVGHGGVFEVKNGVLVKVESIAPGLFTDPLGAVMGMKVIGGGANKGRSALPAHFDKLLHKMEKAGVDVYSGFGMAKPGKDRRRF
jgi:hypothetical protein